MHDAARVDRQLAGRSGRQGDRGSYRVYLALDDELLLGLGPDKAKSYREMGESMAGAECSQYARLFRKAQLKIESRHFRDRRVLMYHEKERKKLQKQMGQDPYLDTPG